jgi:hypothetical protein
VSGDRTRRFRRPGRSSGTANLGIGVAVLAILVPLLLRAATAAPPSAAEFAPNSQHVIKQAPPGQGVTEGPGKPPPPTHPPSAGPTPTPSPSTLTVPENQVLKCVGPPPLRQIEDPQSPPCKAYWKGDNGGATAQGVTRDGEQAVQLRGAEEVLQQAVPVLRPEAGLRVLQRHEQLR